MTAAKASLTMLRMEILLNLGPRLRAARKAKDLTMQRLAELVGVSYPAVQQWETNKTVPTTENLMKLREILGDDFYAELKTIDATGTAGRGYVQVPFPVREPEPNAEWEQGPVALPKLYPGANDIEEKGVTVGGFGADESAFEMNGESIDWVRRPPGIVGRKNVFALRVSNTSMEPKYDDGERIYVEKRHPAIRDFVVVELHPLGDGRPSKSYIKRLVGMNSEKVTVEQYNPKGLLEFGRHEIKNLWRVIPEKELRGEA
jgi:phage repressor protein C with HTH and peptisase S24 domain